MVTPVLKSSDSLTETIFVVIAVLKWPDSLPEIILMVTYQLSNNVDSPPKCRKDRMTVGPPSPC